MTPRALILAAGSGQRMRPLTDVTHKTLLEVGDRTVIDRILDGLVAHGIDDVTVVTGHRADALRAHLDRRPDVRCRYVHNADYDTTNNIVSMALALEQMPLDRDVVLIESDLVFEPSVLARLLASPHANVALVDRFRRGMDGTVVTVHDGVVTSVIAPHQQGPQFTFHDKFKTLNVYRLSAAFAGGVFRDLVTHYARSVDAGCYYEVVLGIVVAMGRAAVHAEVLAGERWAELDDPTDLDVARFEFVPASRRGILERTYGGFWQFDVLDFAYLRNMHFPTDALLSQLRDALPGLAQNYGTGQATLARKLGYVLRVPSEQLAVGNGLSEFFPLLAESWRGQRVAVPSPTFGEYARWFPDAVRWRDDGPGLAALEAVDADVVVVVTPNNPTGTTWPVAELLDHADRHPHRLLVVDSSFEAFSDQPPWLAALAAAPRPNVLVLHSLSKALGVPGLRLGYVWSCDPDRIAGLRRRLPVWNVNAVVEHLLELIPKHRPQLQASYARTRQDRDDLLRRVAGLPGVAAVRPGGGNFVLVELAGTAQDARRRVDALLQRHRIWVKDVSDRFDDGVPRLRLAVRLPHEHARLVAAWEAT